MAYDYTNYTNTWNNSSVLQNQYPNVNDYLSLFGYQGNTPTTPPPSTIEPTDPNAPTTPLNPGQGIINQNINQFQNQGGGGIQGLDPYSRPQGTPLDPNSFLGKIQTGARNIGGSLVDKFSGLPGVEQGQGFIQNIMDNTLVGRMAAMRNPLNSKAGNYNPNLQGQIDFLDEMTGTGITGTSDNLKFTDGLAMIGRDPNSGLGKYGPGSVLSGQNIVSGFGTNDYVGQLDKYIEKMMSYATRSKFQQAKLDRAIAEKKAAQEKAMREEIAKEKAATEQQRQAEANARGLREQVSITAMNKAGNAAQNDRTGGNVNSGGAAGNMGGGSRQATSAGSTKSGRTDGGWGWADGGRVGFKKGGLATMFKLKG